LRKKIFTIHPKSTSQASQPFNTNDTMQKNRLMSEFLNSKCSDINKNQMLYSLRILKENGRNEYLNEINVFLLII
jgi:hypothetical protein